MPNPNEQNEDRPVFPPVNHAVVNQLGVMLEEERLARRAQIHAGAFANEARRNRPARLAAIPVAPHNDPGLDPWLVEHLQNPAPPPAQIRGGIIAGPEAENNPAMLAAGLYDAGPNPPPWGMADPANWNAYAEKDIKFNDNPMKKKAKEEVKKPDDIPAPKKPVNKEWPGADNVISAYGLRASEGHSRKSTWEWYDGVGWIHDTEEYAFTHEHIQSTLTQKWHNRNAVIAIEDGGYCTKEEAKVAGLVRCDHTGTLYDPKNNVMVAAVLRDQKNGMIHEKWVGREYVRWHGDGKVYSYRLMVKIYDPANGREIDLMPSKVFRANGGNQDVCNCSECGKYFFGKLEAVLFPNRDIDRDLPHTCQPCRNALLARNIIMPHDHHHYPEPIFTPKTNRKKFESAAGVVSFKETEQVVNRLFGVEIEVVCFGRTKEEKTMQRVPMALETKSLLGADFVVIKHDGSIDGNKEDGRGGHHGFEIVSAPCDMETHIKRWAPLDGNPILQKLRAWDMKNCGMHVHICRDVIPTLTLGRMLVFVNDEHNRKFVELVAGRNEQVYTRYYPKRHIDALDGGRGRGDDEGRRQAINQQNKNTIEFRIFRSTINYRHIIRNIEYCDAMVTFCYPGARSLKDMKYEKFVEFIGKNRKEWPRLAEWMAKQDMIKLKPYDRKKAKLEALTLKPDQVKEHNNPDADLKPKAKPAAPIWAEVPLG